MATQFETHLMATPVGVQSPRIPFGVYALAAASFAMGTEGYVYVGHLTALAADLNQDVASMGQIATAFAMTYAFTAPFTAAVVARFGRREVLLTGLGAIGAFNMLAGWTNSFAWLIALRIASGIAAGMVGPIASVAAMEIVGGARQGRAMAIVMSGMTGAFLLGIPVGSAIGGWFGWRGTFFYAGAIAWLAAIFLRVWLPRLAGKRLRRAHAWRQILSPPIISTYALTLIGFASTFTTIAYIGPVVKAATGLQGSGVGTMQALIGIGSVVGIALGIRMADTRLALRAIAVSFGVTALAMASYSVIMMWTPWDASAQASAQPIRGGAIIVWFGVSMIAGAAALFSRTPVIQTRLASLAAAEARPVLMALNGSMVFFGQGIGAAIGGLSIASMGLASIGATAGGVALLGLFVTLAIEGRERGLGALRSWMR